MKNLIIFTYFITCLFSFNTVLAARWDGATVDMSGSQKEIPLCQQMRPLYDQLAQLNWDIKCGNKNKPQKPNQDQDYYYNQDDTATDYYDFDWDDWQEDFDRDWDRQEDHRYEIEQYNRELKAWSTEVAEVALDNIVFGWAEGTRRSSYLDDDMLSDILNHGGYFQDALTECLADHIYRDSENVGNRISNGMDVTSFLEGSVRDCYIKIRVNPNWIVW